VQETIKIIESKAQVTDTFRQAGKPKRLQDHNEIPMCFTTPKKAQRSRNVFENNCDFDY
jgi:hypothetical protein